MTTIILDESHCPSGLEKSTYELAFKLRSDRHQLERSLAESIKQIEDLKLAVKQTQKLVELHTNIYVEENEKLLKFRVRRFCYCYNFAYFAKIVIVSTSNRHRKI